MDATTEQPEPQTELMGIAREIPAFKTDILATEYLDIDDTRLSHIRYDVQYNAVLTNFKCLQHWWRNTVRRDKRRVLTEMLKRAARDGLISEAGTKILELSHTSTNDIAGMRRINIRPLPSTTPLGFTELLSFFFPLSVHQNDMSLPAQS